MRVAARRAVLLVAATLLTACAYGRSAHDLGATTFGRMRPPPGSALAYEVYTPAEWNIDGPICAQLIRTYASNDANAFLAAVVGIGHDKKAKYVIAKPPLVFNDDLPGYSPAASVDGVKQRKLTDAALAFLSKHHLLDHPARFDVVAISWPPK